MQLTAQWDAVARCAFAWYEGWSIHESPRDAGEISASSSHEDKDNLTTPNRFSLTEKVIPFGCGGGWIHGRRGGCFCCGFFFTF